MIVAKQRQPILIATRPVDFRCGHRALALIMQTEQRLDPHFGVTIVFRSKRGERRHAESVKYMVGELAARASETSRLAQGHHATSLIRRRSFSKDLRTNTVLKLRQIGWGKRRGVSYAEERIPFCVLYLIFIYLVEPRGIEPLTS